MNGQEWVSAFARELGVAEPTAEEIEMLLDVASVAAHSSERLAAPLTCYLIGKANMSASDALALAQRLSASE